MPEEMNAEQSSTCIVCGVKSSLRCSGCAASGLEIRFCSKEHQSLIWPFHRLFCRENAHPFRTPPFSQEEADLTCAYYTSEPCKNASEGYKEEVQAALGVDTGAADELKHKLALLIGQEAALAPTVEDSAPGVPAGAIRRIRTANARQVQATQVHAPKQPTWLFQLYGFYARYTEKRVLSFPTDTVWFSNFQHRLAAFAFLRNKMLSAPLRAATTGNALVDFGDLISSSTLACKAEDALATFLRTTKDPRYQALCKLAIKQIELEQGAIVVKKISIPGFSA